MESKKVKKDIKKPKIITEKPKVMVEKPKTKVKVVKSVKKEKAKTHNSGLIMLHPLVTEKAVMSIERDNVLTFKLDKKNSKNEIAAEIEDLFEVKVEKVRTSIRGSEKYAYVKLKKEFLAIDIATKIGII